MTIQITITGMSPAPAPDLPGHLFPGAGTDRASFRVTQGAAPSPDVMAALLAAANVDAYLVRYDQSLREGLFVVADGDAPEQGAVITLGADVSPHETLRPALQVVANGELNEDGDVAPTIEQYFDALERHDWYFTFSDDPRAYRPGSADLDRLKAIATRAGGDHAALYEAFSRHYFSGEPWSTPQWDKPVRPVNGVLALPGAPDAPATSAHESQPDLQTGSQTDVATGRPSSIPPDEALSPFEDEHQRRLVELADAAAAWRNAHLSLLDASLRISTARAQYGLAFLLSWRWRRALAATRTTALAARAMAECRLERAVRELLMNDVDLTAAGDHS